MEILFLIGRILFGGYFVMNGVNHLFKAKGLIGYAQMKGVASPKWAVIVSGLFILLGGLGVVLGVYINYAVLLLVLFLIPVSFKMHNFWTISDPMQKMTEMIHFTKNLALLGAALLLLAIPQPWSWGAF